MLDVSRTEYREMHWPKTGATHYPMTNGETGGQYELWTSFATKIINIIYFLNVKRKSF